MMDRLIAVLRRTHSLLFIALLLFSLMFVALITSVYNIQWDSLFNKYHEQLLEGHGYKLLDDMREREIKAGPLSDSDQQWLKRRTRLYGVLIQFTDVDQHIWFDTISEHDGTLKIKGEVPYIINGEMQGVLKLALLEASNELNPAMVNFRKTLAFRSKVLSASIITLSIIISFALASILTRYLRKLDQYAQLIRQGQWEAEYRLKGPEEIRRLAITLREISTELYKQEEWRKSLIEDMMHELRTPITSIMTRVEAIIDGVYAADEEQLTKMYQELERLSRLLHDMQRVTVAQGAQFEMRVKRTNMIKLCNNVFVNFRMMARNAEIDMRYEPTYIPCYAEVDRDKISQVVTNVLSNAIKYTQPGGEIVLKVEGTTTHTIIRCIDSGIGISREDLPYIFDRMYRADKSRSRFTGGVGLGLTIAKALVEAHNGQIKVESKIGEGTVFTVIIPKFYRVM